MTFTAKKSFKIILKSMAYLLIVVIAYLLVMGCTALLPSQFANHQIGNDEPSVTIYLISNGVHTDFVLPSNNELVDWTQIFDPADTQNNTAKDWISIGWGDREFYLNTPTWGDLTVGRAVNALSGRSTSAIHISFDDDKTVKSCQKCRQLTLSHAQYQAIIAHIRSSLPTDGSQQPITNAHYWHNDAFYPAVGSYNLFYTCNSWVNNGLKKAQIKTALWTVADFGVLKER